MLGVLAAHGFTQPVRMVYAVTNEHDLVELEQLDRIAAAHPQFATSPAWRPADSAHARKGYATAHVEPAWMNGGDVDVYLCGPAAMVDAVRSWLAQTGVTPANFYYEKFSASSGA